MSRRKTNLTRYLFWLIVFVVLVPVVLYFWFSLFGGDYSISLPDGYSLDRVNAAEVVMLGPKPNRSLLINSNIDGYKVLNRIVIGHVSLPQLPAEDTKDSIPGFFILDIQSGEVQQGLPEPVWLDSLRKYGITKKPSLHKPSRFDQMFRFVY